jgi:hypothetical protein
MWARPPVFRFSVPAAADTGMVGQGHCPMAKLSSPKVHQRRPLSSD